MNSHTVFHPGTAKYFITVTDIVFQGRNYWTEYSRPMLIVIQTGGNRTGDKLHLPVLFHEISDILMTGGKRSSQVYALVTLFVIKYLKSPHVR